jgi:hypothetical protein
VTPPSAPPPPPAPTPAPVQYGPDGKPLGTKSWSSFYAKDESGNTTQSVTAYLLRDGTLVFQATDAAGKTTTVTQANTPQASGANASQEAVNKWLTERGIDPATVRNDPSIQPPAGYTGQK